MKTEHRILPNNRRRAEDASRQDHLAEMVLQNTQLESEIAELRMEVDGLKCGQEQLVGMVMGLFRRERSESGSPLRPDFEKLTDFMTELIQTDRACGIEESYELARRIVSDRG